MDPIYAGHPILAAVHDVSDVNPPLVHALETVFMGAPLWPAATTVPLDDIWRNGNDAWLRANNIVARLLACIQARILRRQVVFPSGNIRDVLREHVFASMVSPPDAFVREYLVGVFDVRTVLVDLILEPPPRFLADCGPFLPLKDTPRWLNLAPAGYARFIDPHVHAGTYLIFSQFIGSAFWMTWPRTSYNQDYINRVRPLSLTADDLRRVTAADGLQGLTIGHINTTRAFVVSPDEIVAVFAGTTTVFLVAELFSCRDERGLEILLNTVRGLGNTAGMQRKAVLDAASLWKRWYPFQVAENGRQRMFWKAIGEAMESMTL